ncbi:MAG: hypothetical protein WDO56_27920 [Gammaproteobacteria bacterium]
MTLVSTVVMRNTAVIAGMRLAPHMPNITTMPVAMATRLMMTWSSVKVATDIPRIMVFSPGCISDTKISRNIRPSRGKSLVRECCGLCTLLRGVASPDSASNVRA